jgi:hypothetical protein
MTWLVLGSNRGRGHFLIYLRCFNDFITQKVHFLRLMRVYVGLIMEAAYFCHSCKSLVEYNCELIKVDWLDAWIALIVFGAVFIRVWDAPAYSICYI